MLKLKGNEKTDTVQRRGYNALTLQTGSHDVNRSRITGWFVKHAPQAFPPRLLLFRYFSYSKISNFFGIFGRDDETAVGAEVVVGLVFFSQARNAAQRPQPVCGDIPQICSLLLKINCYYITITFSDFMSTFISTFIRFVTNFGV